MLMNALHRGWIHWILVLLAWMGSVANARAADAIYGKFSDIAGETDDRFDCKNAPLSPGFFGPGSQPFDGTVRLRGVPIDPLTLLATDTIIERQSVAGLPTELVAIEMIALKRRSLEPIKVTYTNAPPSFFDVFVELEPNPGLSGAMTLQRTSPGGGIMLDSFFDITYRIDFVPLGGGPGPTLSLADRMHLANGPVPFSYVAPAHYFGPDGFFPDVQMYESESGRLSLTMQMVPEPTSCVLAGCGLAMCLLAKRRTKKVPTA